MPTVLVFPPVQAKAGSTSSRGLESENISLQQESKSYDTTVGTEHSKSLKFAIHFVQRLSTALARNFKMAAFMSVEKVCEMVSRDEVMEELLNDEVTLEDKIKECLKMVENNSNVDVDFLSMLECRCCSHCIT